MGEMEADGYRAPRKEPKMLTNLQLFRPDG